MHATYKLGKNAKLISNFQYFLFQFSNFQFCHFSLLIFNCCQSNFQLLSIDSVTFISVSLSYSVYLRKPILSLPLSLSLSQSDLASLSNGLGLSLSLSLKPPTPNSLFLKPILLFSQILYARDLGLSMFLCFIYVRDLGFFVLISGSFQLNVFFFNRFFFF